MSGQAQCQELMMIEQQHGTMVIMLGEVKREEVTEEVMEEQAGEKVTISRGYSSDILSLSKYNYSIMVFDIEAQAITMYSDSVLFIECCKSDLNLNLRLNLNVNLNLPKLELSLNLNLNINKNTYLNLTRADLNLNINMNLIQTL